MESQRLLEPAPEDGISNSKPSSDSRDNSDIATAEVPKTTRNKRRFFVVEPAFLAYCSVVMGSGPIVEQYLYSRFEDKYPTFHVLHNLTSAQNLSSGHRCDALNNSDPARMDIEQVQEETSRWLNYLDIGRALCQLLPTLFLGAYSDSVGRRIAFVLPCFSSVLKMAAIFVTVSYRLPVYLLLLGEACEGLCGGLLTMKTAAISFVADITAAENRAFRITILTACQFVAGAGSRVAVGYLIKYRGYAVTIIIFGCIQLFTLFYVIVFFKETVQSDHYNSFTLKGALQRTKRALTMTEDRRSVKLLLLFIMFFLYVVPLGGQGLQILYVLNAPLCWGSVLIGIYGSMSSFSGQVAGLVSLKLLKFFPISDMVIAAIGCLSAMSGCLVNAWATDDIYMYIVAIVSLLMTLPHPLIRTTISCLLKPDEQGTVLAVVACVEVISYLTVSPLINVIYQNTLSFMPGFAFAVCAGLVGITLISIIIYIYLTHVDNKTPTMKSSPTTTKHVTCVRGCFLRTNPHIQLFMPQFR